MISLIDTHCHLDMKPYAADFSGVLQRAAAVGVERIISIGIDLQSSRRAVALAGEYSDIYATVGIHPHGANEAGENDLEALRDLAKHPKVVGYGEIGLDFVKKYAPEQVQVEQFTEQVLIAKELSLPLVIHDRDAHRQVMSILQSHGPYPAGGVMHCFSGDLGLAEETLDLGFYVSIPGIVTFSNAAMLQEVASRLPLSCLLLETDGPYLAPVPKRGRRNEPSYLVHTAEKIAQLRGISLDEVAAVTTASACKLFRLQ